MRDDEDDFSDKTSPGYHLPEDPARPLPALPPMAELGGARRARPCLEVIDCVDRDMIGKVFPIEEAGVSIGRRDNAELRLVNSSVSRDHARIFVLGGQVALADLSSTNGTYVNSIRIQRAVLQVGDVIRIGRHTTVRFVRETARWSLRLTDALIAARVALFEWSPDGQFDASRNFPQVTGIDAAQVPTSAAGLLELVHPDDRSRATQAVASMLEGNGSVETEVRFLLPGVRGDTCFTFKVQPGRSRTRRTVAGSIANITARKCAEREIQRLTLVLENMVDAVVVLDVEGRITDWTSRAEKAFALTRDEALGTAVADLVGAHHLAALQRGVIDRGSYTAEIDVPRSSAGGPGVFEVAAAPLKDDDGWVVGYVAAFRDVTARKRLERQVVLSDKLAAMGTLTAGISHEINNPLAFVTGGIDWLTERAALTSDLPLREVLDEMRQGAARIASIVGSMKTFSRTDDQAAATGPVQLARVVELAQGMVSNELRQFARLTVEIPDHVWVMGSETRLMQVFISLIVNAVHAIEAGDRRRNSIHIALESSADGRAVVTVRDTGSGMSPETLDQVFTPFFTTKGPGRGAGLGLSVTRTLVESSGGSISIESQLGAGTLVELRLPLAVAPAAAAQASAAAGKNKVAGTILVIDDEPMVAKALCRLLRSRGYKTEVAHEGQRGVELALAGSFDAIICDLMMPDMTGVDVYERIARERPAIAQRMVFITGGAFTTRVREFVDSGAHPVVSKPWQAEELIAVIARLARGEDRAAGAKG